MYGGSGISPCAASRSSGSPSPSSVDGERVAGLGAPPTRTSVDAVVGEQLLARPQLARRAHERLPDPSLRHRRGSSSSTSAAPPLARVQAQASRDHPRVVDHEQVARPQQVGQIAHVAVLRVAPSAAVDEQAGRVARLDRGLGDARVGQVVVEVAEPHGRSGYGGRCASTMAAMTSQHTESVAVDDGELDLHVWTPDSGSGPAHPADPGDLRRRPVHPRRRRAARRRRLRRRRAGRVLAVPPELGGRPQRGRPRRVDREGAAARLPARRSATASPRSSTSPRCPASKGRPGVLGFCLGGTLAWARRRQRPAERVRQLLRLGRARHARHDRAGDAARCCSTSATQDAYIPNEGVDARRTRRSPGVAGFVLNVENAGHAFDNHEAEMFYNEASATSAWAKTMAFLGTAPAGLSADVGRRQSNSAAAARPRSGGAAPRCAHAAGIATRPRGVRAMQALLDEERLVHVLDRLGLLADADRQRRQPDRTAAELLADRASGWPGRPCRDRARRHRTPPGRRAPCVSSMRAVAAHLGEVADPAQQAVGDARRAPRAAGDLPRARRRRSAPAGCRRRAGRSPRARRRRSSRAGRRDRTGRAADR